MLVGACFPVFLPLSSLAGGKARKMCVCSPRWQILRGRRPGTGRFAAGGGGGKSSVSILTESAAAGFRLVVPDVAAKFAPDDVQLWLFQGWCKFSKENHTKN